MKFTHRDFDAVWPVSNYPPPLYPTRNEAKNLGIELYRLPDTAWKRFGRKVLAGAILLSLFDTGCPIACVRERHPSAYVQIPEAERCLTEAEARRIILDRFAVEGISFFEDYNYLVPGVEFEADGYNAAHEIGFEYYSNEDANLYISLTQNSEYAERARLFLEGSEFSVLNYNKATGSHAIMNFISGTTATLQEERDYLIQQVHEFIAWLKANGKL